MSAEQFEGMLDVLVERYPKVCREIDQKVGTIAEIVRAHNPEVLLHRAYLEWAILHLDLSSESYATQEHVLSLTLQRFDPDRTFIVTGPCPISCV
jgi:hypothetical protein